MSDSTINLLDYIGKIERNELCLPDFQREFVWDGDKIRGVIAAVLAKLPLSSILVVKGADGNEYGLRKLGLKETFSVKERVDLLVDGQQRLTALTQVFSDKIYRFANGDTSKFSNQTSLKEIYYIDLSNEIFGIEDLKFNNPETYLSSDFIAAVSQERYTNNDIFHPKNKSSDRINYAVNRKLLPLFLFGYDNYAQIKQTVKSIAMAYHSGNPRDDGEYENWSEAICSYIKDCIKDLKISLVEYNYSERAKAVDAYESLNIGGVKLDTFDILVARVTHRTNGQNFVNMLCDNIDDDIAEFFGISKGESLNKSYRDKFKKLLTYKVKESSKDKDSLELTSDEIFDNYGKIQEIIADTAKYFRDNFGARTYSSIPYYLMFDLVAFLKMKNKFDDNLVQAWYWISLFANSYDNNQNKQFEVDLSILLGDAGDAKNRLCERKGDMFQIRYTLEYLQGVKEDKPSNKDRDIVEQFYLSQTYQPLLESFNNIVGRIDSKIKVLESNHTIPKSVLVGLKIDECEIDSPLNRALITKDENLKILNTIPSNWKYGICDINRSIQAELGFDMGQVDFQNRDDYLGFLKVRFDNLKGKVGSKVSQLLGICDN